MATGALTTDLVAGEIAATARAQGIDALRRRVLVTGAAGRIGSWFAENGRERYDLRLQILGDEDRDAIAKIREWGEVVICDLADLPGLKDACDGMDAVLHLAGQPSPSATWSELQAANITGTYHLFAAAKSAGVRRVVYASSIHAVSGYPADVQVKTSEPVNPGDLYGVSKCFGEALARYMAEQEGVSAIAVRIGAFQPLTKAEEAESVSIMDAFVSRRDLHQLFVRCIEAEGIKFAIFHGLSNNRFKRLDISDARETIGYAPQDDLTDLNPRLRDLRLSETVMSHNFSDEGQKSGLREEVETEG